MASTYLIKITSNYTTIKWDNHLTCEQSFPLYFKNIHHPQNSLRSAYAHCTVAYAQRSLREGAYAQGSLRKAYTGRSPMRRMMLKQISTRWGPQDS